MDEEDQYLIKVAEVGPRLHVETKLLLKVTTKANLLGRRGERGEWGSRGEQGRKEEQRREKEGEMKEGRGRKRE